MNPSLAETPRQVRPRPVEINATVKLLRAYPFQILLFLLLHVPLAVAMQRSASLATAHALGMFALGGYFLLRDRQPYRLIYVMTYMIGAEGLWRMTDSGLFWEYGKYSVGLLLLLALIKQRRLLRARKTALLYFALLVPSVALLFGERHMLETRQLISFNMSGPFLLAMAVTYFSTIRFTRDQLRNVLLALIPPIIGAAYLALSSTISYGGPIEGYTKITSGGYGQNQMSSMLGLGMLAAALFAFSGGRHRWLRFVMAAVGFWLGGQALLTLARGGLLTGLGALFIACFYLIRNKRLFVSILVAGALGYLLAVNVVIPAVDDITGGMLTKRYVAAATEGDTSGREDVVEADIWIFKQYPWLGVGPGGAMPYRLAYYGTMNSAHVEFSRMLAEHGIPGLMALLLLLGMVVKRVFQKGSMLQRAFHTSLLAWAIVFMLHAAMRLAAPGFLFGLAFATILTERYRAVPVPEAASAPVQQNPGRRPGWPTPHRKPEN